MNAAEAGLTMAAFHMAHPHDRKSELDAPIFIFSCVFVTYVLVVLIWVVSLT